MNNTNASPLRGFVTAVAVIAFMAAAAGSAALCMSSCHGHGGAGGGQEAKQLYTCPMHPSYISDRPGKCPICGMDLVPVKEKPKQESPQGAGAGGPTSMQMPGMQMPEQAPHPEKGGDARATVMIDSARQQLIGVKTEPVVTGPAVAAIRAVGRVAFDPDLEVAQRELIEARRLGDKDLVQAAKRRLALMGMSADAIGALSARGKPDENLVLPGKKAWIYASIYERELPYVKAGQSAAIELPDGKPVGTGTIRAIDPVLDPATRTVRARIEIDNSNAMLKPNMFVTAFLNDDLGQQLLVPKSAVIDSGTRKLVFVVHEGLHFVPRDVQLGPELKESFVVKSGLKDGETVATSALFLIDSESKLSAAAGATTGGHKHD